MKMAYLLRFGLAELPLGRSPPLMSKQLRNVSLRPWERWLTLAHLLLLAGVLVLAMAAGDWGP
jgi:hypothetical protein